MNSLLAGLIILITYGSWGLWLVKRRWQFEDDLDSGFFWSIIPVALSTWFALYLVRPDFPFQRSPLPIKAPRPKLWERCFFVSKLVSLSICCYKVTLLQLQLTKLISLLFCCYMVTLLQLQLTILQGCVNSHYRKLNFVSLNELFPKQCDPRYSVTV